MCMMDVHLSPALQAKLAHWTAETGRGPDDLIEEAMAGYFDELAQVREMLDRRYDELKSGRVQPIEGAEALDRLRRKSELRRGESRG